MANKSHQKRDAGCWYAEGLRFGCTGCCACCGGPPGYVWVDDREVAAIVALLDVPEAQFRQAYCRSVLGRVSLKERENGDCALLDPKGCRIYPVRPSQCRTFPFWPDSLRTRVRWEAVQCRCPGVGQGRLYSRVEIERIAAGRGDT